MMESPSNPCLDKEPVGYYIVGRESSVEVATII